jgi:hypothetical protein
MLRIAMSIALRLGACGLLAWLAWRQLGATGLAVSAPAFGIALARPLIELAGALRDAMRRSHLRDVEGRHYAFRGHRMQVIEDADRRRWVRLADVRAVVGFTASDGALAISYPDGVRRLGRPAEPHVGEEALLAHLLKERSPEAARLRRWVEREVVFPARRERERLGVAVPAEGRDASE